MGRGTRMLIFRTRIWAECFASVSLRTVPSWAHYPTSQTKDLRLRIYGLYRGPSQPVPGLKDLTPFFSITPLHPAQSRHRKKAEGKWPNETGPEG